MCLCHCLYLCVCLCHCLFFGQVMSPHHSDQMFKMSQVSGIALWRCSLNVCVFVIVFVFVFVFVFVIVFFLVRSCLLITLIKCLKGHKSLGSLCCCVFQKVSQSVSESVTRSPIELSAGQLKRYAIFRFSQFTTESKVFYIIFIPYCSVLVSINFGSGLDLFKPGSTLNTLLCGG